MSICFVLNLVYLTFDFDIILLLDFKIPNEIECHKT